MFPQKKENIAEYLLFMWQIEDVLRAYHLNIDLVEQHLVEPSAQTEDEKTALRDWYEGLIMMMKAENLQESGHLQINKNTLSELSDIHLQLLQNPQESAYIATYYKTLPHIVALRAKSEDKDIPELETIFTAMYGYLLLKLQKKEILQETQQAITQMTALLRLLSEKYKTMDNQSMN